MQWREGEVVSVTRRWPGAVQYAVRLADGSEVAALAYPAMVGEPLPGDRVLLNASALLRGLGTGGLAFVVALPDRLPADPEPAPGHIVKARYTPLQQMFLAVDEQDSSHHEALAEATDLAGLPVVAVDLHSALPAVLAGVRSVDPELRVAYVMTDGGALPAAFSRAVGGLRESGWLAACITVGQAFGGDLEAVSLHTGLLASRAVVRADVVVVGQGPGNVGTGTRWGYSGVAVVEALHAAHVLGGRPVAGLRVSGADPRARHHGISHHSRTAYGSALLAPADLPWTRTGEPSLDDEVAGQLSALVTTARAVLTPREVPPTGLREALGTAPVALSTMGRGLDEDPAGFLQSAAAGAWAASCASG